MRTRKGNLGGSRPGSCNISINHIIHLLLKLVHSFVIDGVIVLPVGLLIGGKDVSESTGWAKGSATDHEERKRATHRTICFLSPLACFRIFARLSSTESQNLPLESSI